MNQEIVSVIKRLVESLVANDIDGLVRRGENGRLSKEEIINALQDYPGKYRSRLMRHIAMLLSMQYMTKNWRPERLNSISGLMDMKVT